MRILIYGAGVIGSFYASRFAKAGLDVTVLARGQRLKELQGHGLWYRGKTRTHKVEVKTISELKPNDRYQFIFLTVRENQVEEALEDISKNKSPNVVTMINTIKPYGRWEKICGKGRILPAFPGAGGCIEGGILDAQLLPRAIQPTTFGEIGGRKSSREEALAYIFRKSHIPYQIVPEMHHWQISHLGVIIPLADAYYQSRHPEKICANEKLMTLTAYRMKKNLKWIAQKGMLCPAKLYMIKAMPTGMLARVLSRVYQSEFGNRFLYRHAMHAPEEFQRLHQEFYNYMKTHTKESNKA